MDKVAVAICSLLLSAGALAGTEGIVASNNQFAIDFVSTYVNYTETGNGIFDTHTGTLDTETGSVPGAAAVLSVMAGAGNIYLQAAYDYSRLYTSYTGSLQGGSFGSVMATSKAELVNYSARLGKGLPIRDAFMLTPYLEIGRHEWDRGINYGEIYSHDYAGIGALGQYSPPASGMVFSFNALIGNTRRSYIVVQSGAALNGFSGALGNSVLARFGLGADYAFSAWLHGHVAVDYATFRYGMSAVYPVGGGLVAWEPDSRTYYFTTRLGLGLAF